jgi:N-acetylneuraminic acid mutarotase
VPGARYGSVAWIDSTGDLWLFGGYGLDSNGDDEYLNDLWRFDPDKDTWTWMSGSDTALQVGTYGIQGTPAADNVPGARYESVAWTDNSTGALWLFGGYGLNNDGNEYFLNDLWRYDPDNDTWTWMSGSDKLGKSGTYGVKGMRAADNVPGARWDSTSWMDSTGNLWLFGGYGHASSGVDFLNDLWRYDPDNATWTWMSGSEKVLQAGTYGEKGTSAVANVPGARDGSVAWVDSIGNLLLFGGYGLDSNGTKQYLNDLWRFQPPQNVDMNITIDKCSIKAGKSDNTDSIKFSGWMDAGDAYMIAGDEIVISLLTEQVPDPDATTFSFPINADTYIDGKYKTPKVKSADKSDPVLSFSYDSAKSTMTFSAKNVDLTGLRCPITLTIQIGDYFVEEQLDEDIVNGPKKPCPLPLMMGVWDSLDVSKFKAKKGKSDESDSFSISGSFTVDGPFDTIQQVDITLGSDTFSVPGSEFVLKKDAYSCKKVDIWNGIVTAKFDTVKCTYSIKVKKTTLNGSGDVDFSLDIFGKFLQAQDQVTLPD